MIALPVASRQTGLTVRLLFFLAFLLISMPAGLSDWREVAVPPKAETLMPVSARLWYRCYIQVPDRMVTPAGKDLWRDSMMLGLADIPGPFEITLNGQSIIRTDDDGIPPGRQRRFKVPKGILEKKAFNALVIELKGAAAERGLVQAPVYFGYHHELVLDQPWQVSQAEPAPGDFNAQSDRPRTASYTADQFRRASSVLDATLQANPGKRVPPAEALALLRTEDDLIVEELLHEPEVAQPTHISYDARGRMWVAQYRQYPFPAGLKMISRDMYYRSKYDRVPPPPPRHTPGADLISVHEDRDGDGAYESHQIVLRDLNMANAVLHGRGGIWVMHTPYLLFYPDADGDDIPDGPPEVRLAGFGLEDTHSVANGLAWGPDGWLYGAQGSTTTSRVTRPGIDPDDAPGIYNEGCMVWRYHPDTSAYEIFADGSGNTFGLAFDAEGRLFSGHNGGNTRGWHHIQEGLYLKQGKNPGKFGPPPNPYAFGELPMMRSDHPVPRFSHMTIQADGPALPGRLQGKLLAIDPLHHHVVAVDRTTEGSTFATRDLGFPLQTEDETFRPVYLCNGPDGAITLADFREEYIAHGQNYQGQIDTESGRVYRLRGKGLPLIANRDLQSKSTLALVETLRHANGWHRQTAARLLGERRDRVSLAPLKALLDTAELHPALDALWALHQQDQLDAETTREALDHPAPMVRAWAIRLAGDARRLPTAVFQGVRQLAASEPDAEVRSQVLSTARRLPPDQALPLVLALVKRTEDVDDPFIPLMAWFTLESLCQNRGETELLLRTLADDPEFWSAPLVQHHLLGQLMRRFASTGSRAHFLICARLFAMAPSDRQRRALMEGFEKAFAGRSLPEIPAELSDALAKAGSGSLAFRVRSGDPDAMDEAMTLMTDPGAALNERTSLIRAFGARPHDFAAKLILDLAIIEDEAIAVRRAALAALQRYSDDRIGERLARAFGDLPQELKEPALTLLASRPAWARTLLEQDTFEPNEVSDDLLARLRLHRDAGLDALIDARLVSATPTESPADLSREMAKLRRILQEAPGDPYRGEAIYKARCASCHRLFHRGGQIGPDLTSYQREDLSTLLPSILAPSADIREGYENYLITTADGRALGGFLADDSAEGITLRTFDGADLHLSRSEIVELKPAGRSLMPGALLSGLSDEELRDFFAYLRIPQPISP